MSRLPAFKKAIFSAEQYWLLIVLYISYSIVLMVQCTIVALFKRDAYFCVQRSAAVLYVGTILFCLYCYAWDGIMTERGRDDGMGWGPLGIEGTRFTVEGGGGGKPVGGGDTSLLLLTTWHHAVKNDIHSYEKCRITVTSVFYNFLKPYLIIMDFYCHS